MARSNIIGRVCLAAVATCLAGCVAPDEIWPDVNKPSPAQARKFIETHNLCIKPPVQVVGIANPSLFIVSAPGQMASLGTRGYCFESRSVAVSLVPIDPARTCLPEDYQARYVSRDGHDVVCAVGSFWMVMDGSVATEMREQAPNPKDPQHSPPFRY